MRVSTIATAATFAGIAASYAIPSTDGFPTPNPQQLLTIQNTAGGLLPNGKVDKLSPAGIINFQLIAINEHFEVGYFSSVLDNITNHVPGFTYKSENRNEDEIIKILQTIKAQEEIHALTATSLLTQFKAPIVPAPCTYKFPTTNLYDAISLAANFTAVVLGTLQDASQSFAANGDVGPVRSLASVIGNEAEQAGIFRFFLNRVPSEKPFLTTSVAPYAFSVLKTFIDKCPFDINAIPIPTFPLLSVDTHADAKDMTLTFSADLSVYGTKYGSGYDYSKLFITYLAGAQTPISVPARNVRFTGSKISVDADFPYTANILNGLTIAALTNSSNFASPDDLPANTVAAPGVIQVNPKLDPKEW